MGNLGEFLFTPSYSFQYYPCIASSSQSQSANNHFVDLSLSVSPWFYWNVEWELLFAKTQKNPFGYEASRGTIRYQIWDNLACDPLSLCLGSSFAFPHIKFLKDPSVPFHGDVNAEGFISLGQEGPIGNLWKKIWCAIGFGLSNRGRFWKEGWFFARGTAEVEIKERYRIGLLGDLLIAVSGASFRTPFKGYKEVAHRSLDLGLLFRKQIGVFGEIGLDYLYRPYAQNFPRSAHTITLLLDIPFSF